MSAPVEKEPAKVIPIRNGMTPVAVGEPVQSVVELCRKYLEMAEKGELRAAFIAVIHQGVGDSPNIDGSFAHAYQSGWDLYAGVGAMKRRFENYLFPESET